LEFYCGLLGFKIRSDNLIEGISAETGSGSEGVRSRLVSIKAGGTELELFQFTEPAVKPLAKDQRMSPDMSFIRMADEVVCKYQKSYFPYFLQAQ